MPRKDPIARAEYQREYRQRAGKPEQKRKQARAAYARDPSKQRAASVRHEARKPGTQRSYQRKCKYGLDQAGIDELWRTQSGCCAICMLPMSLGREVVDHDHKTGRVRGLLHQSCNLLVGYVDRGGLPLICAALVYAGKLPK